VNDWMAWLGIKIPDLIAGMFGGVVKALVFHREKPGETVFSGVIGGLMANYLGEGIAEKIGYGRGAVCFAVGIAAMVLCQVILERARALRGKGNGKGNGDA
jgi:hypothetical protein